jgi:O-acetyl-ADP-ribose deacetylase (regulator of RNase III)
MITYSKTSIFHLDVDAIAIPVNCVGVAGAGLALQAKRFIPGWFEHYQSLCKGFDSCGKEIVFHLIHNPFLTVKKNIEIMKVYLESTYGQHAIDQSIYVFNVPTKRHWKDKSDLELIRFTLEELKNGVISRELSSIGLPALGCGLGGLKWDVVKSAIEEILGPVENIRIFVCEPFEQGGIN